MCIISRFFPFVLVTLLAAPVMAQYKADTNQYRPSWLNKRSSTKEWGQKEQTIIYDGSGRQYMKKRGVYTEPRVVIDTITFSGEFAVINLNENRGRSLQRLTPSSVEKIFVKGIIPIITDSTASPPSYGWWINRELNQVTIQSSDNSDTRKVQVSYMVQ